MFRLIILSSAALTPNCMPSPCIKSQQILLSSQSLQKKLLIQWFRANMRSIESPIAPQNLKKKIQPLHQLYLDQITHTYLLSWLECIYAFIFTLKYRAPYCQQEVIHFTLACITAFKCAQKGPSHLHVASLFRLCPVIKGCVPGDASLTDVNYCNCLKKF